MTQDEQVKGPSKILAFDAAKGRPVPEPVDLDSPFFTVTRPQYPACDHRNRGVTLDTGRRKAICLCGEEIDCFDALMIYAHAQQRLVHTHDAIKAHYQKEAEKKAKRPYVKEVRGFCAQQTKRGRIVGYLVDLECGHTLVWDRRKPPRRATCDQCFRNDQLKAKGVAVAGDPR